MKQESFSKAQLAEFVSPLRNFIEERMTCEGEVSPLAKAYKLWRDRFARDRLQLVAQLNLFVCFTLVSFFFIRNIIRQDTSNYSPLIVGGLITLATLIGWWWSRRPRSDRYSKVIFLFLFLSVTLIEQTSIVLLGYHEPANSLWMLIFLMFATLVPVRWRLHLIAQLITVVWYLCIYFILNLKLADPFSSYVERGIYLFWTIAVCCLSVYLYEKLQKKEFQARKELEIAKDKSEKLLLNILPQSIADRLKQSSVTIADSFSEVTVLFADIVGFTELSTRVSPIELVSLLNQIFSMIDELAEKHQLEKIKTIGDAYLVVAGLPNHREDHAEAIANMALDMKKAIASFNEQTGQNFRMRIGISTGPVVAGVIGVKKFAYDLWGDTVNTASRMESHGVAGEIQVCELTYKRLKDSYLLSERGTIQVKGKGQMNTYLLQGKAVAA